MIRNIILRDLASDLDVFMRQAQDMLNENYIPSIAFGTFGKNFPKVNVAETDKSYTIEAALPGYKKDQVKIEVYEENGRRYLSLKGEKAARKTNSDCREIRREVHQSSFHRTWLIPTDVAMNDIVSSMEDGILTIEIPKTGPQLNKREITIK